MDEEERWSYEIRVEGRLEKIWSEWFDGLSIEYADSAAGDITTTLLYLHAADSSNLHGVLAQIGNLNIKLVSVTRKAAFLEDKEME